jgi:hypothetical protein
LKNDFRRALLHGERAAALQPDVSDPHYFLGDVYFELGLLDMVVRELYQPNAKGLLLFSPDDTTKAIFREAMKHYTTARECKKTLDRLLPDGKRVIYSDPWRARARLERAAQYSSDVPEKLIFLEDQAMAATWLLVVKKQPAKQGTGRQAASRMADFVARLTRGGSTGVPTAVPRDAPLPATGEVVHWLDRVYPGQLRIIEASGHPRKERLRAALDLGWLQWAWNFSGQAARLTADSAGADSDRGKARQSTARLGAKVLNAATTLGIALDPVAVQALKSGAVGDEQRNFVNQQIDHHLNRVEKDIVVAKVHVLTFYRVTFLTGLGVLPPELWTEQRKQLERLAASIRRLGASEKLSPERLKVLEDIVTDLLAAGGRGDGRRIDQALFRLEQWCEALLKQILRSSP